MGTIDGLPPQTALHTGRAVFTESYAVIPRGVMSDIVTSYLPGWGKTRFWVIARPMTGFSETFSQYILDIPPEGGSDAPEPEPGAEGVLFVTEGRLGGLDQIQLRQYGDAAKITPISFPEASYTAGLSNNPEYDMKVLRLSYQSMVTPSTVYDYDVKTAKLTTLKTQEIPSGYDASLYVTERVSITARDGTMVPVSIVMRKDRADILKKAGTVNV